LHVFILELEMSQNKFLWYTVVANVFFTYPEHTSKQAKLQYSGPVGFVGSLYAHCVLEGKHS